MNEMNKMRSAIYMQVVTVGGMSEGESLVGHQHMAEDLAIIMCRQHLVGMIGTEIVNAHCN